jgi:hypothetical protein
MSLDATPTLLNSGLSEQTFPTTALPPSAIMRVRGFAAQPLFDLAGFDCTSVFGIRFWHDQMRATLMSLHSLLLS